MSTTADLVEFVRVGKRHTAHAVEQRADFTLGHEAVHRSVYLDGRIPCSAGEKRPHTWEECPHNPVNGGHGRVGWWVTTMCGRLFKADAVATVRGAVAASETCHTCLRAIGRADAWYDWLAHGDDRDVSQTLR